VVSTSTFVAMGAEAAFFGIHAQIVQAIVSDREWEGREPFDVTAALGLSPRRTDAPRPVLLVGTGEKTAPIRALGAVILRTIDVAALWPVPALVRSPFQRQAVSAVAFTTGELPLLVLDPLALMAMAEERDAP
jgi:hypothetical protein